jgi:parallel beta-helix repeat protein
MTIATQTLRTSNAATRLLRVFAAAGCLLGAQATMAASYYVDGVKGNDSNNGSSTAPFKDFWPLMHVLQPGDTAYIAAGTYNTNMYITVSGLPGKPITFMGSSSTNLPKLSYAGNTVQFAPYVSYVNVKYLNVTSTTASGIWAGQGNHHLVIAYNVAHDCYASGIGGWQSDYMTIRGNTVYNNAWLSNQDPSGINLLQLKNYDTASGFHNYIQNNVAYGNANKTLLAGKTYTTDGNGIIIDDARHTLNTSIGPAYTGNTLIENNVVFSNGGRGIHVFSSDNVTIRNNTAYYNNWDTKNDDYHAGEIEAYSAGNVQIYNNIAYSAGNGLSEGAAAKHVGISSSVTTGVSNKADNNLTYGSTAYYVDNSTMNSWGTHNKAADPQFIAASTSATANFKVKSTSPAMALSSTSNMPAVDILNVTRTSPATGGAYQLAGG